MEIDTTVVHRES